MFFNIRNGYIGDVGLCIQTNFHEQNKKEKGRFKKHIGLLESNDGFSHFSKNTNYALTSFCVATDAKFKCLFDFNTVCCFCRFPFWHFCDGLQQ